MCQEDENNVHFIKKFHSLEIVGQQRLDISVRGPEEILLLRRDDTIEIMKAMEYIEDY